MFSEELIAYLTANLSPEADLLKQLSRETHVRVLKPKMLSGHYQGRLLSMISHLAIGNQEGNTCRILEIGTYTGYSALCLAEGLKAGGLLYTIEINPEVIEIARKYFALSVYKDQIISLSGDAALLIPELKEEFDLVFIDADKKRNLIYYELALSKLKKGGIILVDNVLWYGKVISDAHDKKTLAIENLNELLTADDRVDNIILPIRDGIHLLRKR